MVTDIHGTNMIWPDLASANKWESSWGTTRSFNSGSTDPNDSWCRGRGDATYSVSGGILTFSGVVPRLYIINPDNATQWGDVEITCYFRRVQSASGRDEPAYAGMEAVARTNHFNDEIANPCDSRGVDARMRVDGAIDFEKETKHPLSTTVNNKTQWAGGMPFDQWIGYKYICYDLPNGNTQLELYIDTTDGAGGGTWTKINSFIDDGTNFGGSAICATGIDSKMRLTKATTRSGSEGGKPNLAVYFRSDKVGSGGLQYKKASVRSINVSGASNPGTTTPGYITEVAKLPGLMHHFPLNSDYTLNDTWGSTAPDPTAKGTNFKHFVNAGSVTFGADGAAFDGSANALLSAPTDRSFSVCNEDDDNGTMTAVVWINISDYTQGGSSNNLHWFAKGDSGPSKWMEWAVRLYGDGNTDRARNFSNYHWNPDVTTCPHGNTVPSSKGSGAYMAPPAAAPDNGGSERHNGPVGSGSVNTWHMIAFSFTTKPGDRTQSSGDPHAESTNTSVIGYCKQWYGSTANAVALVSNRTMHKDACVDPKYGLGPLTLGGRTEVAWRLRDAKVRRVSFFKGELTVPQLETLRQAHITYGNTEGNLGGGSGGGDPTPPPSGGIFTPSAKVSKTTGAGQSAGASAVTLDVPALGANDIHIISATSNATAPEFATPSGYTSVSGTSGVDHTHGSTGNAATGLFYRKGPAVANAALTVATASGLGKIAVNHMVVPDIDPAASITTAFATGASGASVTAPSVSGTTGQMLVTAHGVREAATQSTITFTPPSGMAEVVESATAVSTPQANVANELAWVVLSSTAATGTKAATSSAAGASAAYSLLLTKIATPAISTLVDSFTTFDSSIWTRSDPSNVDAAGGVLTIKPTGDTPKVTSNRTYDASASNIFATVTPPNAVSASSNFQLQSAADSTIDVGFRIQTDASGTTSLLMGIRDDGAYLTSPAPLTIAYSATNHANLRIRHASGVVYFDTADRLPSAGGSWTNRHSVTAPAWINAVKAYITSAKSAATTAVLQVKNLNLDSSTDPTPSTDVFPLSQLSDNFATQDTTKWNFTHGASVSSGAAVVPATSAAPYIPSRNYWNAKNAFLEVSILPAAGGVGAKTSVLLESTATAGTAFRLDVDGAGVCTAGFTVASSFLGGTVSFSLPAGGRVRIREGAVAGGAADRLYIETGVWSESTQSYVWTNRTPTPFTTTTYTWLTSVQVKLAAVNTSGSSSAASFDNVNTTAAEPITPSAPISDSFDATTLDTTKWTAYGTPTQIDGNLVLDAVEGIVSKGRVNLTGGKQFVSVVSVVAAGGAYAVFRLEKDASNAIQFKFSGGNIIAEKIVLGVLTTVGTVAFNEVGTKYVQFREAAGVLHFEYGPTPDALTELGTAAAPPFSVANLAVRLERSA